MFSKNLIPWFIACTLLFCACNKMYFPTAMPNQGENVSQLPSFLKGTFTKKHQNESEPGVDYLEIKRFNAQHCTIYSSKAFSKEALRKMVKNMNQDSSKAELKGNTLIYTTKDTVETMQFEMKGDLYFSPKDTLCEIDLSSSTFLDDFPDGKGKKLLLKKSGNAFYLNVLEKNVGDTGKDYWFVVKFEYTNATMLITDTSINDSTFSKKLERYNTIADIKAIGSSQYLCTASDKQFFGLFQEPGLFEREVWEPVGGKQMQVLWYVAGLVVVILVIRLLVRRNHLQHQ